jgi:K+-transporting ATPase ATPase C chain
MKTLIRPALSVFLLLSLITGVLYPLLVTAIGQGLFPEQAAGSLLARDGAIVGSRLIGQAFTEPRYFWGRPSATGPQSNNAAASAGSNLGPLNPALTAAVSARIDALRAADPGNTAPLPVDLVTASGSGLDPHISPAAAEYQVARVARLRGLDANQLRELVATHTEGRQLGLLGEPRVAVLPLNLALDQLQ